MPLQLHLSGPPYAQKVYFTTVAGAFGATHPTRWRAENLLEAYPRATPGGIPRDVTSVTIGATVVAVDHEWTFGGRRQRPRFRCGDCSRTCRYLYMVGGKWTCRLCSRCEHTLRHRRRFKGGPALARLAKLRAQIHAPPWPEPLPLRPRKNTAGAKYNRLLPLIAQAEAEVRASLARVLGDLEARARRSSR